MAELLRAAQFDVTEADNLAQAAMAKALRDFAGKIAQSGPDTVALVFYAGHGVQIDGENYLVPVTTTSNAKPTFRSRRCGCTMS